MRNRKRNPHHRRAGEVRISIHGDISCAVLAVGFRLHRGEEEIEGRVVIVVMPPVLVITTYLFISCAWNKHGIKDF